MPNRRFRPTPRVRRRGLILLRVGLAAGFLVGCSWSWLDLIGTGGGRRVPASAADGRSDVFDLSQSAETEAAAAPAVIIEQAEPPARRRPGAAGGDASALPESLTPEIGPIDPLAAPAAADEPPPALQSLLHSPRWELRVQAVEQLGRTGAGRLGAGRYYTEALADPHPLVRMAAARAIALAGRGAAELLPVLMSALDDPHGPVRYWAANALGAIGPGAAAAIPKLSALAGKPGDPDDVAVARAAAEALGRIGPPPPPGR